MWEMWGRGPALLSRECVCKVWPRSGERCRRLAGNRQTGRTNGRDAHTHTHTHTRTHGRTDGGENIVSWWRQWKQLTGFLCLAKHSIPAAVCQPLDGSSSGVVSWFMELSRVLNRSQGLARELSQFMFLHVSNYGMKTPEPHDHKPLHDCSALTVTYAFYCTWILNQSIQ